MMQNPVRCKLWQGGRRVAWNWLALLAAMPLQAAFLQPVSHLVHVSVDGLAALYLRDYVSNAPAQFPTFARLVAEGAFTFNARCDFDFSTTIPNHADMFTGRPALQPDGQPDTVHHGYLSNSPGPEETLHADGNPAVPYKHSVFDVVHDHGLTTAFFSSKSKFSVFIQSYDAAHGAPDAVGEDNGPGKMDFALLNEALTNGAANFYQTTWELVDVLGDRMTNAPWQYVFLHFAELDLVGPTFSLGPWGSPHWSNSVRYVDAQVGRILAAIENAPALSGRTALLVTTDHGGGGNYFGGYSHDDPTQVLNYTIPIFLWGPGVPAGQNLYHLVADRADPGPDRPDFNAPVQPLRNGDTGNLALRLLGLPLIPGSSMVPELPSLRYPLQIGRAGDDLKITWPVGAVDYILERAESLAADAVWSEVTNAVVLEGARNVCVIPRAARGPAGFFRLRAP